MASRPFLMAITIITLGAYAGNALIHGKAMPADLIGAVSPIVGALSIIALLHDKWLWALPIINLLQKKRPDLRGTWRAKLISDYIDPQINKPKSPFTAYFSIYETNSSLTIRQYSEESDSVTLAATINTEPDDTHTVAAVYDNTPSLSRRNAGSTRHHGGFILRYSDGTKVRLKGQYWTDRKTTGEMDAERISSKNSGSLEEAQELDPSKKAPPQG